MKDPLPRYEAGGVEAIYAFFDDAEAHYGIKREAPPSIFNNLAFALVQSGRLREAQAVLSHDPETVPPPAMLYTMLAREFQERGDDEEVIACYSRALEINPTDDSVRAKLTDPGVDADAVARKPTQPSADSLQEYTGKYLNKEQARELSVDVREGQLTVLGGPTPSLALKLLKEDRFVAESQAVELVFERNASGEVNSFSVKFGSREVGKARRIPAGE